MKKFTVAEIEEYSKVTRNTFKGRRGFSPARSFKVSHIRSYCDRVDFLCRTIRKLERKVKK